MPTIKIPRSLQKLLSSPRAEVITEGKTTAECLNNLLQQNPDFKVCFSEYGNLLSFVNIYRGSENVRHNTALTENDTLEIVVAMSGG